MINQVCSERMLLCLPGRGRCSLDREGADGFNNQTWKDESI